jgi:UDP-3-O-[3-hydroxymyristoyl] glucosamine N-acyltransferase
MAVTLGELAGKIGGELRNGDPACRITSVATLQHAGKGEISFLANKGYRKFLPDTGASAVILAPADADACPTAAIILNNPYAGYARAAALLAPPLPDRQGIHPRASVDPESRVDPSAWIGPHCNVEAGAVIHAGVQLTSGCHVGSGSVIGACSRLGANVVICHDVSIGERVTIAAGAVIGSDGFGLAQDKGKWINVPQLGSVRIGNDVDIGANTTIDRGALEDTILEEGVRLDNQIQVAHNVFIGAHTAIAGCVGISGSARIGRNCLIGGGAGIVGHLEITDNVVVTGMTMVTRSITRPGVYSSGVPAQDNDSWNRNYARFRQLDKLARKVQRLEQQLAASRDEVRGG